MSYYPLTHFHGIVKAMNEFVITATRTMKSYAAGVAESVTRFPSFSSIIPSI
jgi:hypothetical protein